jgi:hypothetical protein
MKTRYTIIIFVVGLASFFIGGLLKVLHLQGADEFLIVAIILQVVGVLVFIFKLLSNPKLKEFLNW